jgi:hypothetical protein
MVSKEKKIFHYDIFEDTIDGQRLFGVKLIDGKVIAKTELLQKKAEEKHPNVPFCISRQNG